MEISQLKSLADAARHDPAMFDKLASRPEDLIAGFDVLCDKVDRAIAQMSPETAMDDLLSSPSNDHCIRSSCGCGGSIITS